MKYDDEYHLNIFDVGFFFKLIFNLRMMWPISIMNYSFFLKCPLCSFFFQVMSYVLIKLENALILKEKYDMRL